MAFKDIFNKGIELINSGVKTVSDAAKEKKASMQKFEELKSASVRIGPMYSCEIRNDDPQPGKEQMILKTCLSLNAENARVINKMLPIDETVVDVRTCKEAISNLDYCLVATDKRLWIVNKTEYMVKSYEQVGECEIINKGIMSQGVEFDGQAFTIDGTEESVKSFFEVLKNFEYRNAMIKEKLSYLCGVTPAKQMLNKYLRGLTFGINGEIVLHNDKENRIVTIKDIVTIQLLINDSVTMVRGRANSTSFMSSPMEARKMSIKIITNTGEFLMETMPPNTMGSSYKREDSVYIENYEFAKKIVDTLGQLINDDIYGR